MSTFHILNVSRLDNTPGRPAGQAHRKNRQRGVREVAALDQFLAVSRKRKNILVDKETKEKAKRA
jgi:hypothetical protein